MNASSFTIPIARFQAPINLITASAVGSTSTTSNAGCVKLELSNKQAVPRFTLQAKVTNSATAPGATKTVTVYYAFSGDDITDVSATGAPLQFEGNAETALAVALQNTVSVVQRHITAPIEIRGRYLYVWYDITALGTGATVSITVDINWLG